MIIVRLHGLLAKAVGKDTWRLAVTTVSEALRAIEANTGKLYSFLQKHENGQAMYRIMLDDADPTSAAEIAIPLHTYRSIDIIPVIGGASNGGWLVVVGVILMAVAVIASAGSLAPGVAASFSSIAGGLTGLTGIAFSLGLALTVGGIGQLLSGRTDDSSQKKQTKASDIFQGAVNTYDQGNPVPVLYGELLIGSQVISLGITTLNQPA